MGSWGDLLSFAREIIGKISPIIEKISVYLAEFIKVESSNIHNGIVLTLSIWLAYLLGGKRLGLGTLGFGVLIFIGLHYLGL